jgi:His-Xaa-Ser repeat protein HxsA
MDYILFNITTIKERGNCMSKLFKKIMICLLASTLLFNTVDMVFSTSIVSVTSEAHSGRTDSNGGHKDNKNKSGLGSYHYHCGGYPAHLHSNGECPYATTSSKTTTSSKSTSGKTTASTKSKSSNSASKSVIKKVQKKLNELGYDCGTPDGIMGKKTKKALKEYQEDYDLTVDGVIGKEVKKSLGID